MKRLDFQVTILRAIAAPKMKRRDVAVLYMLLLLCETDADFKTVNQAIMDRWSVSGLITIKEMAWHEIERRKTGDPRDPKA